MTSARWPATVRWVLLCLLAVGVLSMHHVPDHGVPHSHETPAVEATAAHIDITIDCSDLQHLVTASLTGHCPTCGHDLLHLCLAVLIAITALALNRLRRHGPLSAPPRPRAHLAMLRASRGPPPARRAPEVLASLCVLRL